VVWTLLIAHSQVLASERDYMTSLPQVFNVIVRLFAAFEHPRVVFASAASGRYTMATLHAL
jgi:hypothetical protein